jgi:mRNA interferase HigB
MRLVTRRRLAEFVRAHPDARASLEAWRLVAERARWLSITDVRRDFPHADGVPVGSARTVTVFNIRGNNYRLITAIHYNAQTLYVMRFYTHAEYDKGAWKETL